MLSHITTLKCKFNLGRKTSNTNSNNKGDDNIGKKIHVKIIFATRSFIFSVSLSNISNDIPILRRKKHP